MPKKQPGPFWRESRQAWYVQFGVKQVRLGKDEAEAIRRYHELMAERSRPPSPDGMQSSTQATKRAVVYTVALLDDYLAWVERNKSVGTYRAYKQHVVLFCRSIPTGLPVCEVKPFHLTAVLDAHPEWGVNTRGNFVRTVKGAFNWGAREGYIEGSPVDKVKSPAYEPRETVVSPDEWAALMDVVRLPAARDLLELAYETGTRPQEIRAIEARHVKGDRVEFARKESKGKRHARTIYLGTDRAREIVARLCKAHPSGPICRNSEGAPWTKDAVNCIFVRAQKKTGRKFHLGALRKSFATQAIINGVDPLTTAHLMGHRNTDMVAKVYARVQQDVEHMVEAAKRAKTPKGKVGPERADQ